MHAGGNVVLHHGVFMGRGLGIILVQWSLAEKSWWLHWPVKLELCPSFDAGRLHGVSFDLMRLNAGHPS